MKLRQITIPVLVFVLISSAIASGLLGGTKTITSDLNSVGDSLLTVNSVAHIIWVPIYLMLAFFAVHQALKSSRDKDFIDSGFLWLAISLVANSAWWLAKLFDVPYVSPVLLLVTIGSLVMTYYFLNYYLPKFSRFELEDRLLTYGTVSLYLGWTMVLFLGELSEMVIELGVTEFLIDNVFWAAIVMILMCFITVLLLLLKIDIPFGIGALWGLYGIYNHAGIYELNNANTDTIYLQYTFYATAILIILGILFAVYEWNSRRTNSALEETYF